MSEYPPYHFLIKCFEDCPSAVFTYILLWMDNYKLDKRVLKTDVQSEYLTHLQDFKEHIFLLKEAELLSYSEFEDSFRINLSVPCINAKGMCLC